MTYMVSGYFKTVLIQFSSKRVAVLLRANKLGQLLNWKYYLGITEFEYHTCRQAECCFSLYVSCINLQLRRVRARIQQWLVLPYNTKIFNAKYCYVKILTLWTVSHLAPASLISSVSWLSMRAQHLWEPAQLNASLVRLSTELYSHALNASLQRPKWTVF